MLLAPAGPNGVPFVSLAKLSVRVPQSATVLVTSTWNEPKSLSALTVTASPGNPTLYSYSMVVVYVLLIVSRPQVHILREVVPPFA